MTHLMIKKDNCWYKSYTFRSVTLMIRELTSLQSPLSDLMAERAQTCPIVGSHLNLIVSPDDEVLQQQVGHIMAGNVLDLVVHRQPSETVPEIQMHPI